VTLAFDAPFSEYIYPYVMITDTEPKSHFYLISKNMSFVASK
jgi:hypothetical protein